MKNILVISFFILFIYSPLAHCQGQDPLTNPKLPTILPVSPIAAELGLYGNLPLNLSTGRLNKSVDIYEIKVGKYSFPISLNYNFGGLLAEQDPSVAGLGWTLNVPGSITRQVQGLPDDKGGGYINGSASTNLKPYVESIVDPANSDFDNDDLLVLYKNISEGNIDTEPDKFNINAFNLNANFFINWDEEPKIAAPFKDYKITIDKDINNEIDLITVTGEDGVIYEFGIVEKSSTSTSTPSGEGALTPYGTAYYISKIKFPDNSDEITFLYEGYTFLKQSIKTYNIKYKENYSRVSEAAIFTDSNIDGKILTQINFPRGKVVFNNSQTNGFGIPFLESIEIKDNDTPTSTTTATYDFTYSISPTPITNNEKLRTLLKIEKTSGIETLPFYEFEYYGVLPNQLSLIRESQDIWGFYNDAEGALHEDDKRFVHFENTLIGALQKITYPTGGTTEIYYEQNKIPYTSDIGDADFYCGDIEYNDTKQIAANSVTSTDELEITIPSEPATQIIKIYLVASVHLGNQGTEATAEIELISGQMVVWDKCPAIGSTDVLAISEGDDNNFKEASGFYEVTAGTKLKLKVNIDSPLLGDSAEASVEYYNQEEEILSTDVGGIRVKKTIDCANPTDCYSKEYKYTDINVGVDSDDDGDDDVISSGVLVTIPQFLTNQKDINLNPGLPGWYTTVKRVYSNVPLASYNGSHILYKKVTVLDNENDDNGITEHFFTGEANGPSVEPWIYKDPEPWKKGNQEKQKVFKKENSLLELVSESISVFEETVLPNDPNFDSESYQVAYANNIPIGFKAFRSILDGIQSNAVLTDFITDKSFMVPKFYVPIETSEKQYLDNGEISSLTTTIYDDTARVLESTVETSIDDKIMTTKYKYPKHLLVDPQMSVLVTENRIAQPIQVESYQKKGTNPQELLTTQKTEYGNFNGRIHPKIIKTLKGVEVVGVNEFKDRIQYLSYDGRGNPKEVSQVLGATITYLWGYNGQFPVAKVENATYAEAIATGVNLSVIDSSNPSDLNVQNEINKIRIGLPNAQVTTYTFTPLIGVNAIVDPKGYKMTYYYDEFNRLKYVKDQDDKVLSENQYHYKN